MKMKRVLKKVIENSFESRMSALTPDIDYVKVDYCSDQEEQPLISLLIPIGQCKKWIDMGKKFALCRQVRED